MQGKSEEGRIRLNKFLSRSGICSRRRADELIAAGRVSLDGRVVSQMGLRVHPETDRVSVDGKPVAAPREDSSSHVYLALHKPAHVVTTLSDPQNRTTILHLLPASLREKRILPAGRLDYLSEGLLLLSTDGNFLNRVTHPSYHLPKEYRIKIKGGLTGKKLKSLQKGMVLEGDLELAPVGVKVMKSSGKGTHWLQLTLQQGINRQVRRMCNQLNWEVLRLIRTAQGPVELGDLQPRACRHLTRNEIRGLLREPEV
ncbi:MAG: rRNA pseudouridine synthase [Desulfohalobiaceae bacterium]|nr:rRNA pseudouridine synthase [Desulfohalobiaceae bacterium]